MTGPERTPLDAAQLACLTHIPRGNQRRPRYHPPAEVEPGVVLVELSPDPRDQWGRTSFAAYWHGRRPGSPPDLPDVIGQVYYTDPDQWMTAALAGEGVRRVEYFTPPPD